MIFVISYVIYIYIYQRRSWHGTDRRHAQTEHDSDRLGPARTGKAPTRAAMGQHAPPGNTDRPGTRQHALQSNTDRTGMCRHAGTGKPGRTAEPNTQHAPTRANTREQQHATRANTQQHTAQQQSTTHEAACYWTCCAGHGPWPLPRPCPAAMMGWQMTPGGHDGLANGTSGRRWASKRHLVATMGGHMAPRGHDRLANDAWWPRWAGK